MIIQMNKEKIYNSLMLGAIGDSMWLATEFKTQQQIKKEFWGYVKDILSSLTNEHLIKTKKAPSNKLLAWIVSDDTLLTFKSVESIVDKQRIDLFDILSKYIKIYEKYPYFLWRATQESIKRFISTKSVRNVSNTKSLWNWALMRIAPIILYLFYKRVSMKEFEQNIIDYTKLTHSNKSVIFASLIYAYYFVQLLNEKNHIKWLENTYDYSLQFDDKKFSKIIEQLLKKSLNTISYDEFSKIYAPKSNELKTCWNVYKTLEIVIALFLHDQSFNSLIKAVNIWWDTDTYASILGNMLWAYKEKPKKEFLEKLVDYKKFEKLINKFILTINNN